MTRILLVLILLLILPIPSEAAYKIYLKDGSVISGVTFYEKKGEMVTVYFKDGSMLLSEKEIVNIEGTESTTYILEEIPETADKPADAASTTPQAPAVDNSARINALKTEIESLIEDIKSLQEEETELVSLINEKSSKKTGYNRYELIQLEKELEPLRQDVIRIQQEKAELIQKKAFKEGELRSLLK